MKRTCIHAVAAGLALLAVQAIASAAPTVKALLPLGRPDYQTNETIDISASRSDTAALSAGTLTLTVTGADASKMVFTFPVNGAALVNGTAATTDNLHLNGWLLRPQKYTADITVDGVTAETTFTVYSHVRASDYKTVHWGGTFGPAMLDDGVGGLAFNLDLSGAVTQEEQSIPAGMDIMGNCLMGGGHQFNLVSTDDWSDPNVYLGAIQVGIDRAFAFRTLPTAIGAHLYDEPGLTWLNYPRTAPDGSVHDANVKGMGPHDIPSQRAAYTAVYGQDPIWYDQVDTTDPVKYAAWKKLNDFKLGFMDAFWKASADSIDRLKPGFFCITQSQYGWSALYDGYYYNVVRSLPVVSGHGGYNDFWLRNFNPSLFLEMALPRQLDKPTWYLPEWYGNISIDEFRLEHNMSFITGVQGMSTPPGLGAKSISAPAIKECNTLYQKIGTIFTKPEYTPEDVAVLFSKSNQYYNQQQGTPGLGSVYMATKLLHYPISVIVEEDILDGSLAAGHKAVILTGFTHLDQPVIDGLVAFIKGGGTVLQMKNCTVDVPGAVKIDADPEPANAAKGVEANKIVDPKAKAAAMAPLTAFQAWIDMGRTVASALKPALLKAGIRPTFFSDVDTIAAGKQVRGDVEYDFAVNFTTDKAFDTATNGVGTPVATTATITLPDNGRPVYDAVTGKEIPFKKGNNGVVATLAFGPGQMYAFARPIRPIGGVVVGDPVVAHDLSKTEDPISLSLAAARKYTSGDLGGVAEEPISLSLTAQLVDAQRSVIAGNVPMELVVTDPSGGTRFDIYRCGEHGVLSADLPMAANDPAGKYTVKVTELLSGMSGTSTFNYIPPTQCGAVAGETRRATYFFADKPNVYDFFRNHRNVTIVPGSSPYDMAAAQRLQTAMASYDVTCTIANMADVDKARTITDDQAQTWVGDVSANAKDPNARKSPDAVGYNLSGPTVLIGNAGDNDLIKTLTRRNVLPYTVTADFPGVGQGLVAWNLATLGHDIEALALIGNDEAGVNQAVGTAVELGIGIDPLTPFVQPVASSLTFTTQVAIAPPAH